MGVAHCHPVDVLSIADSLFEVDAIGAVIVQGQLRHSIIIQSGIVDSFLFNPFPNLHNVDFWYSPAPLPGYSNDKTNNAQIASVTLASSIGMQDITITSPSDGKITLTGSVDDVIKADHTWGTALDAGGVQIPAGAFSSEANIVGDVWYMGGYTCNSLIVLITATLVACAQFRKSILKQSTDVDTKLLGSMYNSIMKEPVGLLPRLRDGTLNMEGRVFQEIGQWLQIPAWIIDPYGRDITNYDKDRSGEGRMY